MFNHLHVHTEYSPLDGMSKLSEVVARAKELGQDALAITDHGSLYGLWKFQNECDKQGIKPILGSEFYMLNGHDAEGKPMRGHLILLAKDDEGLKNLFKLQEVAHAENFYSRPMITWDNLKQFNKGLVCTSACLANIICQEILAGHYTTARQCAEQFKDIFGDDFYLEIQPNNIMEQHTVNKELVSMSKSLHIPLVATNDVHYVYKEDCDVHEVLLAISTNKKMDDPKRWKFPTNDFWLKSEDEMRCTFNGIENTDISLAILSTTIISSKCNARLNAGKYLPSYPFVPAGKNASRHFAEETFKGHREKLEWNQEYFDELKHEVEVITTEGYADYFLIVQDAIKRARDAGLLVGDGRGSGAGSKVCYALDITRVEPKEYNLLFERFLDKGREPDIDSDFSDIDALFELLGEAYGWENVARIVSFGTFAPKAVNRKILSIFGHDIFTVVNPICKLLSDSPLATWKDAMENKAYLDAIQKYPREWKCIQRLQGNVTNSSMHAGGVIIWNKVSDVLPVKCILDMKGNRRKRVVCFDMDDLHELHHYKFDFLGLKNLELQHTCLKHIKDIHGVDLDFSKIDYEDPKVLAMIASGDLLGIFQLSDQPERVMEQAPKTFRDIIAINALIRPGSSPDYFARRKGTQPYVVRPEQKAYMEETYGVYVYQEQYMQDANTYAGWSIGFADKHLRKNKKITTDTALFEKWLVDCATVGLLTTVEANDMWLAICDVVSGGYGFNKSHATTYGRIAYQNAYMKYYFPECFYASLLTKHGDDPEKVGEIIAECKAKHITILPPSIIDGGCDFTPRVDGISYRLSSIKGLGDEAFKEIIRLRPITSLDSLCNSRNRSKLKNNNIVSLIQAGVFDFENADRQEVMYQFDMACRTPKQIKDGYICERRTYSKSRWEYEALGLFLTEHALDKYAFAKLSSYNDGQQCLVAGIVGARKVFPDKNKREMAFITISNQFETIKLICFSSVWNAIMNTHTEEGNIIYVKGKRQGKDVLVNEINFIEKL